MLYTVMNDFFQNLHFWKQAGGQKIQFVTSGFACSPTKGNMSLAFQKRKNILWSLPPTSQAGVLTPRALLLLMPGHDLRPLAQLREDPVFWNSTPLSRVSPVPGPEQRFHDACLISSRSIFISPSHSPSLGEIQTARFSFKVKNWQSP